MKTALLEQEADWKKTRVTNLKVAALIVGINGWEDYTLSLIQSILQEEPGTTIVVVDNQSDAPYPQMEGVTIVRTERLNYSQAINLAKREADKQGQFDWYIVLSNDVLCWDMFQNHLEHIGKDWIIGGQIIAVLSVSGYAYHIQGWAVCISDKAWKAIGDWDETFELSSWEDVDYSLRAVKAGFGLKAYRDFPFSHQDQKQRGDFPDFEKINLKNFRRLCRKHDLYAYSDPKPNAKPLEVEDGGEVAEVIR